MLTVGLIGIAGEYAGLPISQRVEKRKLMTGLTGIDCDRCDLSTPEQATYIKQLIAEGVKVLPVYDHVEYGQAATALPKLIAEAGLNAANCPVIEIRNEPQYDVIANGVVQPKVPGRSRVGINLDTTTHTVTAAEYAKEFADCAKVLVGTGIEPGLKVWSDYYDWTTQKWSQGAAGRGFTVDTCEALGWVPPRKFAHLYGAAGARGLLGGGPAMGWGSLVPMNEYLAAHNLGHITDVSECGQKASVETGVPAGEVSLAEQASAYQQYVLEGDALGLQSLYIFSSNDGNEGHWGAFTSEYKPKPAVAVLAAAVRELTA